MPVLNLRNSHMIVMPQSYSPSAIARRFEVIQEMVLSDKAYSIIYDKSTPFAAVIEADITLVDGQPRHRVVAKLDMIRRDKDDEIFAVRDFWQDTEALQVDGVVVDKSMQDIGLATKMYECLVIEKGITLMSDNTHYEGGKALWQKIARSSAHLTVYVFDTEAQVFYPYDGSRVRYDGICIPENEIWSLDPDVSRYGVILVAEDSRKHPQPAL